MYNHLPPLFDTTKMYFIDNKSADIRSLNFQNDHSNFLTSVVHNSDFSTMEAGTHTIQLDDRSRWGGELQTTLTTNMPNVNDFSHMTTFRVKLMTAKIENIPQYEWVTLTIPEGNYSLIEIIDLMNNAVVDNYLAVGRNRGVLEEDIGVKFDTRNMKLGWDPVTRLVMPGLYTYQAFHPDVILAPGCAVDFTETRLNNVLGIRRRFPFQPGFVLTYEDLIGGNIPALLDLQAFDEGNGVMQPLKRDSRGRSYHVGEDPSADEFDTHYRSWYLAYQYARPEAGSKVRAETLLTVPDVTGGAQQVYWSLPDICQPPVSFRQTENPHDLPVVGVELLPMYSRSYFNAQAVYAQLISDNTNQTHVFNRFPNNQILVRPPAPIITAICENTPAKTNHGILPIQNTVAGVQRVTVTDSHRRHCPYVYKCLGVVSPRVLSSKTF